MWYIFQINEVNKKGSSFLSVLLDSSEGLKGNLFSRPAAQKPRWVDWSILSDRNVLGICPAGQSPFQHSAQHKPGKQPTRVLISSRTGHNFQQRMVMKIHHNVAMSKTSLKSNYYLLYFCCTLFVLAHYIAVVPVEWKSVYILWGFSSVLGSYWDLHWQSYILLQEFAKVHTRMGDTDFMHDSHLALLLSKQFLSSCHLLF